MQMFPVSYPAPPFLIKRYQEVTLSLNFYWEVEIKGLIEASKGQSSHLDIPNPLVFVLTNKTKWLSNFSLSPLVSAGLHFAILLPTDPG